MLEILELYFTIEIVLGFIIGTITGLLIGLWIINMEHGKVGDVKIKKRIKKRLDKQLKLFYNVNK